MHKQRVDTSKPNENNMVEMACVLRILTLFLWQVNNSSTPARSPNEDQRRASVRFIVHSAKRVNVVIRTHLCPSNAPRMPAPLFVPSPRRASWRIRAYPRQFPRAPEKTIS